MRTLVLILMTCTMAVANPSEQPCSDGPFGQFDFWIGEWDVKSPDGKLAGRNSIRREQNGCVVVERWTSARGDTGMSMNHYDPQAQRWHQHWVGLGLILDMSGAVKDGAMILEGPLQYVVEKRVTLLRGEWTRLPDGRVRQHFTESSDGGKTWSEWFDGHYSRIDSVADAERVE